MDIENITLQQDELPFKGFREFVQAPLEADDPSSLERIKDILLDTVHARSDPFRLIIQRLTNKIFRGREAQQQWRGVLRHKRDMEAKLGRRVGIQVAALDYFEGTGTDARRPPDIMEGPEGDGGREESIARTYAPAYHQETLKREILRSRRYNHALSALMMDIDEFHKINEKFSLKTGDEVLALVVKIIHKVIRAVDIAARYSGDRFLIILPDTNKREALELAERLRRNVNERTRHLPGLAEGLTATIAAGQASSSGNSADFVKQLENMLEEGKKKGRNSIYSL